MTDYDKLARAKTEARNAQHWEHSRHPQDERIHIDAQTLKAATHERTRMQASCDYPRLQQITKDMLYEASLLNSAWILAHTQSHALIHNKANAAELVARLQRILRHTGTLRGMAPNNRVVVDKALHATQQAMELRRRHNIQYFGST